MLKLDRAIPLHHVILSYPTLLIVFLLATARQRLNILCFIAN